MPFNLIKALLEQGAKRLTLVVNTTGGAKQPRMPDIGTLVENGQVAKVICSFTAATRPTDVLPFTKYYESGQVDAELVPQGTLAERMRAAGAGIPAFYTPAAVGTELAEGRETRGSTGATTCWNTRCRSTTPSSAPAGRHVRQPAVPAVAAQLQSGHGHGGRRDHRRGGRADRAGRRDRSRTTCIRPAFSCTGWCRCQPAGGIGQQAAGAPPMSGAEGLTRQQMADRVGAGVPGRLDRQSRRRHPDHVLQHRSRRPRHDLSRRERRHRLRPVARPARRTCIW